MVRYVTPVRASAAQGLVAEVYSQMRRDFGMLAEPMTLHSPIPRLLAGVWASFKECLIAGPVRRDLREAIAVSVSRRNQCPYCIDAHSIMLRAAGAHAAASAIQSGDEQNLEDKRMRALVSWAAASRTPRADVLQSPPFSSREAPYFIGTAVWTHYINRMVSVFLAPRLLPISSRFPGIRAAAERMGGWYFSRPVRRPAGAGSTMKLLPAETLPEDLRWAGASEPVAQAFAALAAAVEEFGALALGPEVRARVRAELDAWNGEDPGLGRNWVEGPLAELEDKIKPDGRLALLAALAPYQVDEAAIRAFRGHDTDDERLLGGLAWASFSAARVIGRWLSEAPNQTVS